MLKFKQWLDEAYDFTHQKPFDGNSTYHFSDEQGNSYHAAISKMGSRHYVDFSTNMKGSKSHTYSATGHSGHGAAKIFKTMHNILKHHAQSNPDAKEYHFTSEKDHYTGSLNSRNKLYSHFTKRLGGKNVNHSDEHEVDHFIPAHKLRQ